MEQKLLTVFTPTYNRKSLLHQCYESLQRQNCRDFLWLIVDDGSDDGTEALVRCWEAEGLVPIRYLRKENGGLHTAYNAAIAVMDTELAVCVDSDDYLADDAVGRIAEVWRSRGGAGVAGIVALNRTPERDVLGVRLPELETAHLIDLYCRHRCRSDLKMIYRTQLLKQEGPIPEIPGEKDMNPYYLFLKIDRKLPMLLMNEPVCMVNYQPGGMSTDVVRQYVRSPRSFGELRLMMVSMERATLGYRLKNSVHLVSSALLARDRKLLTRHPDKWILAAALLPGLCLGLAVRTVYRRKYQS
jgi:glycosyltransferase involved in cell wall biosynthesis